MATATTTIDDRDFQQAIRRLTLLNKKELPVMVRQSARRVAVNLSRYTVPFGFEESVATRIKKTIAKDHNRVFITAASVSKTLDEEQKKQFAWLTNNSTPGKINRFLASVGMSELRTRRNANKSIYTPRRATRGKVNPNETPTHMVLNAASVDKMIANAQKRVGLAKYGWAMCARHLGGTRGIPSWVKRGRGISKPAATVQETMTQGGIHIAMTNNVPYVSRLLSQSNTMRALNRERDFLRQEIQRRVKQKW